jgi:hypothetical protein
VWKNGDDMRDVVSIGKLVRKSDGPQEIELIMNTLTRYGEIVSVSKPSVNDAGLQVKT